MKCYTFWLFQSVTLRVSNIPTPAVRTGTGPGENCPGFFHYLSISSPQSPAGKQDCPSLCGDPGELESEQSQSTEGGAGIINYPFRLYATFPRATVARAELAEASACSEAESSEQSVSRVRQGRSRSSRYRLAQGASALDAEDVVEDRICVLIWISGVISAPGPG